MAYGITLYNDTDGGLTLSDQGITFGYIGMATLYSVSQATFYQDNETQTREAGVSIYMIDWPGDIYPVLPIKENGGTKLLGFSKSGNTWTIRVHKSNGSADANNFFTEEATEVYVFGAPAATVSSNWGIALYNDAGALVGDLTRRPLNFAQYIELPSTGLESSTISTSIVKPGILGNSFTYRRYTRRVVNDRVSSYYQMSWRKSGSSLLVEPWQFETLLEKGQTGSSDDHYVYRPSTALIIELNGL